MAPIARFPDPRELDPKENPEGIVALGGDLHPFTLLQAYRQGIFPWPIEGMPLAWFCPPRRAILRFSKLHVSRSLARERKKAGYWFTVDAAFDQVIEACSEVPRPGQRGTWITPELLAAYREFHRRGHAHSVETWWTGSDGREVLAGGIYGVDADGAFAGESMFFRRPNASKLALLHLVDHLRDRGLDWMDIQMMTPHMKAMGAETLSRERFLLLLEETRRKGLLLFPGRRV